MDFGGGGWGLRLLYQPSWHIKCCHCAFLQTTDMLVVVSYISYQYFYNITHFILHGSTCILHVGGLAVVWHLNTTVAKRRLFEQPTNRIISGTIGTFCSRVCGTKSGYLEQYFILFSDVMCARLSVFKVCWYSVMWDVWDSRVWTC